MSKEVDSSGLSIDWTIVGFLLGNLFRSFFSCGRALFIFLEGTWFLRPRTPNPVHVLFSSTYIWLLSYISRIDLQYVTEKMGAAEGTKMDEDFVEMERVCSSWIFSRSKYLIDSIYKKKYVENGYNIRVSGGTSNENQGVSSTQPNCQGQNGSGERYLNFSLFVNIKTISY